MKNFIKVIGFWFLWLLIFWMFFTILNNNKKSKSNILDSLSGSLLSVSWSTSSWNTDSLLSIKNNDIEKNKIIKTIKNNNIAKKNKILSNEKLAKNILEKQDKLINNFKTKEEIKLINNIKKEVTWEYIPVSKYSSSTNLETEIGKIYEVWVYSLKINDKTFKIKKWYLLRGDRVTQLEKANTRWCFKMKVISSKNQDNVWKVWYVCNKYLKDYSYDSVDWKIIDSKIKELDWLDANVWYVITTKVWNIYSINSETNKSLKTDRVISKIEVWTIVEQVDNEDRYGCFVVLVLTSYWNNKDVWKIWYICKWNIERTNFLKE